MGRAASLAADVGLLLRLIGFIAWLIFATWIGRKLLGWLWGSQEKAGAATMRGASSRASRQLYRDPVCGMHVTEEVALTLDHGGKMHHFCSAECREKFRAAQQSRRA